jgi:hypothetical protein
MISAFSHVSIRPRSVCFASAARAPTSPQSSQEWHTSNNSSVHSPSVNRLLNSCPERNIQGYATAGRRTLDRRKLN